MRVAVFGLGKLGLPMAVLLRAGGHDVIGVDRNARAVGMIAAGVCPVDETGLANLFAKFPIPATTDGQRAVAESELSMVVVPTPSLPDHTFTNEYVLEAVRTIGAGLRDHTRPHVVVINSTVMPGSCDGDIRGELESASGRSVGGGDVGLVYNPEFIALGSVLVDMRHPDMVLIGQSDAEAGFIVESLLRTVIHNHAPAFRMSLVNAEIAKLALNAYVTMKISFANTLGELCERIPGGDAWTVTGAIGADERVGPKYLAPATAYGGPCFPRDAQAFSALAQRLRVPAPLAAATRAVNNRATERLISIVRDTMKAPVGILGLAYKPGTSVSDDSPGGLLAAGLILEQIPVVVYDPVVRLGARSDSASTVSIEQAASAQDCIDRAQVVVVACPWAQFADCDFADKPVIDCWGIVPPGPNVYRTGIGAE